MVIKRKGESATMCGWLSHASVASVWRGYPGYLVVHRSFDVEKHLLSKKIDAHDDDMMHVHLYSQQKKS